jgi:hypothetical protein
MILVEKEIQERAKAPAMSVGDIWVRGSVGDIWVI